MFAVYTSVGGRNAREALDAQTVANAIQANAARMTRKSLLAWASDYALVPDLVSRSELIGLFKEVTLA